LDHALAGGYNLWIVRPSRPGWQRTAAFLLKTTEAQFPLREQPRDRSIRCFWCRSRHNGARWRTSLPFMAS
jgi:hypothetical protein